MKMFLLALTFLASLFGIVALITKPMPTVATPMVTYQTPAPVVQAVQVTPSEPQKDPAPVPGTAEYDAALLLATGERRSNDNNIQETNVVPAPKNDATAVEVIYRGSETYVVRRRPAVQMEESSAPAVTSSGTGNAILDGLKAVEPAFQEGLEENTRALDSIAPLFGASSSQAPPPLQRVKRMKGVIVD